MMKILLTLFVLLFSSTVVAEDISDFEIEGISVGDSLLDYYSNNEILENIEKDIYKYNKDYFKDTNYYVLTFNKNFKLYKEVQIYVKRDDKKFKIHGIDALILYRYNIKECDKKMNKIVNELSNLFTNFKKQKISPQEHSLDSASIWWGYKFIFDSGGKADVTCYDWSDQWSKKKHWYDNLRIGILNKELTKIFK